MRYTNQNSQLIKENYYIIYFGNILNPELLPIYFINKNIAKTSILKNISKKSQKLYKVVRGNKVSNVLMHFNKSLGYKKYNVSKYEYPDHCIDNKTRKLYRKNIRRRLRRMGMYTKIMPQKFFTDKPQIIKIIKNTQKQTQSPNTIALAFRLQRKPKNYYYIIRKKEINNKTGRILMIKSYRIDMKKGIIKKLDINILRKDIIIPYLLSEINYLINQIKDAERKQELINFWARKNFPTDKYKRGQKIAVPFLI